MSLFCDKGNPSFIEVSNPEIDIIYQSYLQLGMNEDSARAQAISLYLQRGFSFTQEQREELEMLTVGGLTPEQQYQAIASLTYMTVSIIDQRKAKNLPFGAKSVFDSLFDGIKRKSEKSESEDIKKYFDIISDNRVKFERFIVEELSTLGIEVKGVSFTTKKTEDLSTEGEESIYEVNKWEEDARFSENPLNSVSARVRIFLSKIPAIDSYTDSGLPVRKFNFLGFPMFEEFNTVYNELIHILADTQGDISEYAKKIRENSDKRPYLRFLAETLEGKTDLEFTPEMKRELMIAMRKHHYEFVMFRVDAKTEKGTSHYSTKVFFSNRQREEDVVLDSWIENQKQSALVKHNYNGDLIFDKDYIAKLRSHIKKVITSLDPKTPAFTSEVDRIFRALGIHLEPKALASIIDDTKNTLKNKRNIKGELDPDDKGSLIGIIFDAFAGKHRTELEEIEQPLFSLDNPLFGSSSQGIIKRLAKINARYAVKSITSSLRNVEGKSVYTFQNKTRLSIIVEKIKDTTLNDKGNYTIPTYLSDLATSAYSKASVWAQLIQMHLNRGRNITDDFNVYYIDGVNVNNDNKGKIGDMSEIDQLLISFALYNGFRERDKAAFVGTTKSDKPTTEVISFLRIQELLADGSDIGIKMQGGTLTDLTRDTRRYIMSAVQGELDRIFEYQRVYKDKMLADGITVGGIKTYLDAAGNKVTEGAYQTGAELFFAFPYLNAEQMKDAVKAGVITQEEYDKVWNNRLLRDYNKDSAIKDILWKVIKNHVIGQINSNIEVMRKRGLIDFFIDKDNNVTGIRANSFSQKFISKLPGRNNNEKVMYAIVDHYINNLIYISESYKLFSGDPAHATKVKTKKDGTLDETRTLIETIDNIQKRLAGVIAPFISGSFPKNDSYVRVTVADRVVPSTEAKLYASILGRNDYDKLESTDAQEYTTLEEDIKVMLAYQRITQEEYNLILATIEAAKNDPNNPTNYFELKDVKNANGQSLLSRLILQPRKPVSNQDIHYPEYGFINYTYTKSSSFPLIPELTKGFQIDRLRVAMENQSVARVSHASADKLGAYTIASIYDEKGNIKKDIDFTPSKQVMGREMFGLQMELPYGKSEMTVISQMNKLIFGSIREIKDFVHRGVTYTGEELEKRKEKIRAEMFKAGSEILLRELGATYEEVGQRTILRFESIEKVQNRLVREAISRGWSVHEIKSLDLEESIVKGEKEFILPLSFGPAYRKIESLLLSIVKRNITHRKISGKGYIQASSAGFISEGNNNLVMIEGKNLSKGLRSVRYVYDKSLPDRTETLEYENWSELSKEEQKQYTRRVAPAQVIIPFAFKDNQGNTLAIEQFTRVVKGQKYLNMEAIPPELLQIVSGRIPNQGHSSMLPLEIVGFTIKNLGSLMIVPDEITKQMGSDFDIDKLYGYIPQYSFENGKLVPFKYDTNNLKEEYSRYLKNVKEQTERLRDNVKSEVLGRLQKVPNYGNLSKEEITTLYKQIRTIVLERRGISLADLHEKGLSLEEFSIRAYQQEYIEILSSILLHPDLLEKLIQPLDVEDLKEEAELIQEIIGNNAIVKDPTNFFTQIKDRLAQKAGKDLISIFAIYSVMNALLENKNVRLDRKLYGNGIPFRLDDGTVIWLNRLSGTGNASYDGEARSKEKNIIAQENAALDNAKENISNKLNINIITAGVSGMMTLLANPAGKTLNLSYNGRLLMQEAVRLFVDEYQTLTAISNTEFSPLSRDEAAFEKVRNRLINRARKIDPDFQPKSYTDEEGLTFDHAFSPAQLLAMLKPGNKSVVYYQNQLRVLDVFKYLHRSAKGMQALTGAVTSAERKGTPSTFADLIKIRRSYEKFMEFSNAVTGFYNAKEILSEEFEQAAELSYNLAMALFNLEDSNMFFYNSNLFSHLIGEQELFKRRELQEDEIRKLWESVRDYMVSIPEIWGIKDMFRERQRLTLGENSLARRVQKAKTTWGSEDFFLQRLQTHISENNKLKPDTISYLGAKGERTDEYRSQRSIANMLLSPDPEHRALAVDLVRYSYFINPGLNSSSFGKYIPLGYLQAIGITEAFKSINFNSLLRAEELNQQVYQHNPSLTRTLKSAFFKEGYSAKDHTILLKSIAALEFASYQDGDITKYVDYLSYRDFASGEWRLFKLISDHFEDRILYKEIPVLGSINVKGLANFNEYHQTQSLQGKVSGEKTSKVPVKKAKGDTSVIENGNYSIFNEYIKEDLSGIEAIEQLLTHIQSDSFKDIAAYIKRILDLSPSLQEKYKNFKVKLQVYNSPTLRGLLTKYGKETFLVIFTGGISSREVLEQTIVHELLHLFTKDLVASFSKNEALSPTIKENIIGLDRLRNIIIARLNGDERAFFEKILEATDKIEAATLGELSQQNPELFDQLYPLSNLDEFVAGTLTTPLFQRRLASIKIDSDLSAIERFVKFIANIFKAVGNHLGLGQTAGTAFEEAFTRSMILVNNDFEEVSDSSSPAPVSEEENIIKPAIEEKVEKENVEQTISEQDASDYYDDPSVAFDPEMLRINEELLKRLKGNLSIGTTVGDFMRTLDSEQRNTLREFINEGIIKFKCQ